MATGSYDANGIWNYGEDDNIALFSDTLNMLAESTSDAFTDDRNRISTLEAGSLAGLVPVKPLTVTASAGSASVNDLGTVTFTNVTSIILDNLFNVVYRNYKIVYNATNTPNGTNYFFQVRASGSTTTSGYYGTTTRTRSDNNTASIIGSTTNVLVGAGSNFANHIAGELTVFSPQIAARTHFNGHSNLEESNVLNYNHITGSLLPNTNQYTGIVFSTTGTAGLSGQITVYGYND